MTVLGVENHGEFSGVVHFYVRQQYGALQARERVLGVIARFVFPIFVLSEFQSHTFLLRILERLYMGDFHVENERN